MRDKIIKERLGVSITNFLPQGNPNMQQFIAEGGMEILTMNDIDKMSKELILPSLSMTRSSAFIPGGSGPKLTSSDKKGGEHYGQHMIY